MKSITRDDAPSSPASGLLINRNFTLLWTGDSLSSLGDMIFDMTLLVWVAVLTQGQPWSPLAISGLLVAAALPTLLVGPVAGVLVDRWDKRRTMLVMDATRAALVGLLALTATGAPLPYLPGGRLPLLGQLGMIFGVVLLASVCAQFFNPARFALIGDVVEDAVRPKASSLTQTTQSIATLLGPAVAPPLFLLAGATWALGFNALSFVASFALILAMRVPPAARSVTPGQGGHFLRELREGWRFTITNRFTSTLLVAVLVVMFGASMVNALDILFALQRLQAPLGLYGLLAAMMGVGMLGGAALAGAFARRIGLARLLTCSLVIAGISLLVYSRLTSFAPALLVMCLIGASQVGMNVAVGPLVLHVTPRELVGRVKAVFDPAVALVVLLGTALSGYLAGAVLKGFHASALGFTFGPIDTIFTAGALLVLAGALFTIMRIGFTDPPQADAPAMEVATHSAQIE